MGFDGLGAARLAAARQLSRLDFIFRIDRNSGLD